MSLKRLVSLEAIPFAHCNGQNICPCIEDHSRHMKYIMGNKMKFTSTFFQNTLYLYGDKNDRFTLYRTMQVIEHNALNDMHCELTHSI